MMVVLAVSTIILLAINMVFNSLSAAVSLGSGQSQVLAAGRAVGDYLYDDFKHMVGPGSGGFMVIINRSANSVNLLPTDTAANAAIRDDQILFIRDRAGLNPICPAVGNNTYAPNPANTAPYVRLWYGHGTEYDGNKNYGPFLQTGSPNGYACQWVLARQALFLNGSPGNDIINQVWSAGGNANPSIIYGVCDNVQTSLLTLDNYLRPATSLPSNSDGFTAQALNITFLGNPITVRRLPYAYFNGALPAGQNPADGLGDTDFSPPAVARTHAYFVGSVSDFIIDFAACTNANHPNEPDYSSTDGSTQWYGTSAWTGDGVMNYPGSPAGLRYNPNQGNQTIVSSAGPSATGTTYIFEHGDVGSRDTNNPNTAKLSAWPYLVRIRYRVHDPAGKIVGADGLPGRLFEQILYVNRN
jgi:hypothetical protein